MYGFRFGSLGAVNRGNAATGTAPPFLLSGVAGAVSAGTTGPQITKALTGAASTGAAGTLGKSRSITLTANAGVGTAGSLGAPATTGFVPSNGPADRFFPAGAYTLPYADRFALEAALDTYGTVILDDFDYTTGGVPYVPLKPGQRLIGIPNRSVSPEIRPVPGCSNAMVKGVSNPGALITFAASSTLTEKNTFGMLSGTIDGTNCTLSQNFFYSVIGVMRFDTTTSGYMRNNRFYRIQNQNAGALSYAAFKFWGKSDLSSWGNTLTGYNCLTPFGQQLDIRRQANFSMIGFDSESYADPDGTQKPAINVESVNDFRAYVLSGNVQYQPAARFDCTRLTLSTPALGVSNFSNTQAYQLGANVNAAEFIYSDTGFMSLLNDAAPSNFRGMIPSYGYQPYVGTTTPASITGAEATAATDLLVNDTGTYSPWGYYPERAIPDFLGPNWAVGLAGQPDSTATIQALIDAGNVVRLSGVYYLGSSLRLKDNTVIIGGGKDNTALVGKTGVSIFSDVDLVGTTRFGIYDITLQGDGIGIHQFKDGVQNAYGYMSNVIFRNLSAGYFLDSAYSIDNCFFENLDFVNCGAGFKTRGTGANNTTTVAYVDKSHFFRCQFVNCGYGKDMSNTRVNNLNIDYECLYKDNTSGAYKLSSGGHNYQMHVNTVYQNNGGSIALDNQNCPVYYMRCKIIGGAAGVAMTWPQVSFEGCEFSRGSGGAGKILDTPPVLGDYRGSDVAIFHNCISTDMPIGTFDPSPNVTVQLINSLMASVDAAYNNPIVSVWCDTKGTPGQGDDTFSKINPWLAGTVNAGTKMLRDRLT